VIIPEATISRRIFGCFEPTGDKMEVKKI